MESGGGGGGQTEVDQNHERPRWPGEVVKIPLKIWDAYQIIGTRLASSSSRSCVEGWGSKALRQTDLPSPSSSLKWSA